MNFTSSKGENVISKVIEFVKEVKTRKRRKIIKGKIYEYEEPYVNIGRITLPNKFKQLKKVKVKVFIEPC